jgi:hypothetical protein
MAWARAAFFLLAHLRGEKAGMRGARPVRESLLAEHFAQIIDHLWSVQFCSEIENRRSFQEGASKSGDPDVILISK